MTEETLPEVVDLPDIEYQIIAQRENGTQYRSKIIAKNADDIREKISPDELIGAFGLIN
jgi:hypothetical protein